MVMVRNPKPNKWFIYGYGLVGQNIRPCTPLSPSFAKNILERNLEYFGTQSEIFW